MSMEYMGKWHVAPPTGHYVVGYTDIMTGPGLDGCFVRLFYPAELRDVYEHYEKWATWIPHFKYVEGYASVLGVLPFIVKHFIAWAFRNTHIPIVKDAPPAEGKFPVILFTHGVSACRTSFSIFCSDMASHGFVVAAIEHRDASACVSYGLIQQGDELIEEWVLYARVGRNDDFELRQKQLERRVSDCQRTLELLNDLNDSNLRSPVTLSSMNLTAFQGFMDFSNVGIAGHSFGGATLLRVLGIDKRFKFGVVLDPWMWPLKERVQLPEQVDQPLLFINMEAFQTRPNLKFIRRFLNSPAGADRRVVTLRGSVHLNQCDMPLIMPSYLKRFSGAHSTIDPHLAMSLNNRMSLLFIWKHTSIDNPAKKDYEDFLSSQQPSYYEGINNVD